MGLHVETDIVCLGLMQAVFSYGGATLFCEIMGKSPGWGLFTFQA